MKAATVCRTSRCSCQPRPTVHRSPSREHSIRGHPSSTRSSFSPTHRAIRRAMARAPVSRIDIGDNRWCGTRGIRRNGAGRRRGRRAGDGDCHAPVHRRHIRIFRLHCGDVSSYSNTDATPTASPTATPTVTPSATPTATPTVTSNCDTNGTATATPTPTVTPTATITPRPTPSPRAHSTPRPRATPPPRP